MKKNIQRTFLAVIFLLFYTTQSFSGEKYYVDDQFVLLYKLINWWYSCEEDDCGFLCGRKLKTVISGGENIALSKKSLIIKYSDLLVHLPNKKVLSQSRKTTLQISDKEMKISLSGWDSKKRKYIRKNLKSLSIVVTGSIKGIYNSDILILNGKFDRECPGLKDDAVILLLNKSNMKVVEKFILVKK